MKYIRIISTTIAIVFLMTALLPFNTHSSRVETMIKVAFDPNLPPYQFLEDGKPAGIHVDMLNSIAEKNNYVIEYEPMDLSTDAMDALENSKVDIVLGVLINKQKSLNVKFTESISESSLIMIALDENASDVKSKINTEHMTAAFQSGTIGGYFIQNMRYLKSIILSNSNRAFEMLDTGLVDVMIGEKNTLLYQIGELNAEERYTITNRFVIPVEYSMAVRQADEDLAKVLNTNIAKMRVNGDYEKIYNKWIKNDGFVNWKQVVNIIIISAIVFLGIIVFNVRHSYLLKKQVHLKTKELQESNSNLQKQIVRTLHNSEVKKRITEDNPNSIIMFNLDYIITLFNPSASRLTDLPNPPIGKSIFEVDLLRRLLSHRKDELFKMCTEFTYESMNITNAKGDEHTYRYIIYHLFDPEKRIRGAILSIEDVTEESKEREEMMEKEKNKALNQLIAGVAHEIRNPLMAIKTFVELIPTKKSDPKFQSLMAQYVPEELNRIDNLVKSLIDYAKPEVNNKEVLNIQEVINSCVLLISASINQKEISVNIEVGDGLLMIGDKNQLKQILMNIILNGLESIKEKKEAGYELKKNMLMDISAWKEGNHIFVQLYDEGLGMDESEIGKSMKPFYTTKARGTGLGLPMIKHYVEENGGTMTIESEKNAFTSITLKFRRYYGESDFNYR